MKWCVVCLNISSASSNYLIAFIEVFLPLAAYCILHEICSLDMVSPSGCGAILVWQIMATFIFTRTHLPGCNVYRMVKAFVRLVVCKVSLVFSHRRWSSCTRPSSPVSYHRWRVYVWYVTRRERPAEWSARPSCEFDVSPRCHQTQSRRSLRSPGFLPIPFARFDPRSSGRVHVLWHPGQQEVMYWHNSAALLFVHAQRLRGLLQDNPDKG